MNIIIAVLIFGIIIFVHELGHFLLAKINGIFVTEFSLGMGKRLISFIPNKDGYKFKGLLSNEEFEKASEPLENTIYSLKVLPFGGSCMMLGEDENLEDDRAFNKKGVWARISVIFAGAFFNFILAFVLSMVVIGIIGYDPPIITGVTKNSAADEAGLQEGDIITKIDNNNITINRDANTHFLFNELSEKTVDITYERDGIEVETRLDPQYKKNYMLGFSYLPETSSVKVESLNEEYPMYKAGIRVGDIITKYNGTAITSSDSLAEYLEENPLKNDAVDITYERDGVEQTVSLTPEYAGEGFELGYAMRYGYEDAGPLEIVKYGLIEIQYNISTAISSIGMVLTGGASTEDLAGPVGIVNIIGDTYQVSKEGGGLLIFINLASLTIMISANVGVFNLLPLPALDGGRLVFLFLELIRRKPVPPEKEGMVHFVGIMALMVLMILVLFNDIRRILPI